MENSNNGGATPKQANQFAIVTRIAALLKLDDAGRLEKFFTREVKKLERAIAAIEANKSSDKLTYDIKSIELTEVIEDAQAAVIDAYESVNIDAIKSNSDSDYFANEYWNKIENAEVALVRAEKKLVTLTEQFDLANVDYDKSIKARKARIAKIK